MVAVESTMLALGTKSPNFALPDTSGNVVSVQDFEGKPVLVAFICNHCPYVKHVAPQLKQIGDDFATQIQVVAINSNDIANYPDDSPEKMVEEHENRGYAFPYLFDADQSVAIAYTAACTPDFFLFNAEHKLYYRGQMDGTRPKRISSGVYDFDETPATGADLREAIRLMTIGENAPADQKPSLGCNIKWQAGNEPNYFKD